MVVYIQLLRVVPWVPMDEMKGYLPLPKGYATDAIHFDQDPEKWSSMAVVPPIVTATTYKQYEPGNFKKFEYGRSGNPTREVLENLLAKLENAKYGLTFSSGLGAITALIGMFKAGDNVILSNDIHGGIYQLFMDIATKLNIEITLVDATDVNNISRAIKPNTKLIWLETPTNPTVKVVDIKSTAKIAKNSNIILAVDNTFLTSYLQRPLDFGADLVVYSLTKYMNGHADVIMGAIVTSQEKLYEELKFLQNAMGIIPSPRDCHQVIRGLKTLPLRMRKHVENSLIIGKFLETHNQVEKVLHPGLPSHPHHNLFKSQTCGHSGTFSFYLKGNLVDTKKFLSSLKIFTVAGSLGSPESLVELPILTSHAKIPSEQKKAMGITDNLIRISVGLEDFEDLVSDLKQAFETIRK